MVEHRLAKARVASSNLVFRSKYFSVNRGIGCYFGISVFCAEVYLLLYHSVGSGRVLPVYLRMHLFFCALKLRFAYQARNLLLPALVQCCAMELHFADSSAHWTFACLSISHRTTSSSTRQSVRLSTSIRNIWQR